MQATMTITPKITPFHHGLTMLMPNNKMHVHSKITPGHILYTRCTTRPIKPNMPSPNLTIQMIEFTFTHDRYMDQAIKTKQDKYNPLVTAIKANGWLVSPLIAIIA